MHIYYKYYYEELRKSVDSAKCFIVREWVISKGR